MKILIVYDSAWGNTEKIAQAIAGSFGPPDEVAIYRASNVTPGEIKGNDLVFIGSPTQSGRPTKLMQDFLDHLSDMQGSHIAVFDTRLTNKFAVIFGFAARKMADNLKNKGGVIVGSPEGYFVKGSKGPLVDGELERAAKWAKNISESRKIKAG